MGFLRKTRGVTICYLCAGGGSLLRTVSLIVTLPWTQESKPLEPGAQGWSPGLLPENCIPDIKIQDTSCVWQLPPWDISTEELSGRDHIDATFQEEKKRRCLQALVRQRKSTRMPLASASIPGQNSNRPLPLWQALKHLKISKQIFTHSLGAFLTATSVLCPGVNESFKRSFPVHYSSLGLMIMSLTGFQSLMIWGLVSQAQVLSCGARCGVQTSHSWGRSSGFMSSLPVVGYHARVWGLRQGQVSASTRLDGAFFSLDMMKKLS